MSPPLPLSPNGRWNGPIDPVVGESEALEGHDGENRCRQGALAGNEWATKFLGCEPKMEKPARQQRQVPAKQPKISWHLSW